MKGRSVHLWFGKTLNRAKGYPATSRSMRIFLTWVKVIAFMDSELWPYLFCRTHGIQGFLTMDMVHLSTISSQMATSLPQPSYISEGPSCSSSSYPLSLSHPPRSQSGPCQSVPCGILAYRTPRDGISAPASTNRRSSAQQTRSGGPARHRDSDHKDTQDCSKRIETI